MTEKTRYPYQEAMKIAAEIQDAMTPYVDRIEIAGSLRRQRAQVGDIEILFIPRYEERQADMFTTEPYDLANEQLCNWLNSGYLSKRPKSDGTFTWGKLNKLAIHGASGIPVDFFATTPENWYVSLVIRTGGKDTNLKLTTGAIARRRTLNAYGSGYTTYDGEHLPCKSEEDVFALAGVPYAEPKDRA